MSILADKAPTPPCPSNTSIRRGQDFLGAGIEGFQAEGSNVLTALYANAPRMRDEADSSAVRTPFGVALPVFEAVGLVDSRDGEGEEALEGGQELRRSMAIEGKGAGPGTR